MLPANINSLVLHAFNVPIEQIASEEELKLMGATPGLNKKIKKLREKRQEIHCGFCPYNKGDNALGKRRPRSDKHKNHRRKK